MSGIVLKPRPEPLPATVEDLDKRLKASTTKTLNDYVHEIHRKLWADSNPQYRQLLDAVYDEDAVEGSLSIDNAKAAEMIRNYAKDAAHPEPYVASKKLATIVKALNIVLRRFQMTRKERAHRVEGEQVAGDN
jgi:hypothetical protein